MAHDPLHPPTAPNSSVEDGPSGPRLPGSPREHRQAVLDALGEAGGRLSIEALARDVGERPPRESRLESRDGTVQRALLAHVIPPLVAEGEVAFSPERSSVALAPTEPSGRRTPSGGVVSAVLVVLVVATQGLSSPVTLGAAGLALLSVLYLARRRIRDRLDRVWKLARGADASEPVEPAGSAPPSRVPPAATAPDLRILAHLLAAGGRMRQQTLIDRLGRSESTVSRHVSSLAEDGFVTKVPVGRENLVCLPGSGRASPDVPEAGSAFDRRDAGD